MNQTEASEELGCSISTVSRICSGERSPSLDLMYVIRDKLRWSIEAQADEIRCGTYAQTFQEKIERRQVRRRVVDT